MAGAASVLIDDSPLIRLDQRLERIERVLALVSGLAVFSLMILAVVSVGGRNFFAQPLPGYVDWIEQAMPLIAFAGISYVQRNGGHIRMDILVGQLRGRFLWVFEFLTTFAILLLMLALVWGSWSHFARSFDFAAPLWSRDSSMDIAIPLWPAKLVAPVAFAVLSLRIALQLVGYGRAILTGAEKPAGLPLIEDVATQAQREAEQLSGRDD
ncbi:MAG: TRAP transporter small permease [Pseudomonadota bacterium]